MAGQGEHSSAARRQAREKAAVVGQGEDSSIAQRQANGKAVPRTSALLAQQPKLTSSPPPWKTLRHREHKQAASNARGAATRGLTG